MTKKDYEKLRAEIKKWKSRQKKTLTRIRKEAKENNERINITYAKLMAVRNSCLNKDSFSIAIKDVDNSNLEFQITIDKI